MWKTRLRAFAFAALCVLLLFSCAGCGATSYILYKILAPWVPEPEVKAQYDLKQKSIVVLVDFEDPLLADEHSRVMVELARKICLNLEARQAIGAYANPRDVVILRQQEPDFDRWPVSQVGQQFGVDLVMYLNVIDYRLKASPASSVFQGHVEVGLCLIKSETGEQAWPEFAPPRLIQADTLPKPDIKDPAEIERILTEGLADKIARLFYTYKKSELSFRSEVR